MFVVVFSEKHKVINSLAAGRCGSKFKTVILQLIIQNSSMNAHCEITLRWKTQNFNNDKSTLVRVMAWCCKAPIHYLSQCWPRSLSSFCVIKPQWVKVFTEIGMLSWWPFCHHWLCWGMGWGWDVYHVYSVEPVIMRLTKIDFVTYLTQSLHFFHLNWKISCLEISVLNSVWLSSQNL